MRKYSDKMLVPGLRAAFGRVIVEDVRYRHLSGGESEALYKMAIPKALRHFDGDLHSGWYLTFRGIVADAFAEQIADAKSA